MDGKKEEFFSILVARKIKTFDNLIVRYIIIRDTNKALARY